MTPNEVLIALHSLSVNEIQEDRHHLHIVHPVLKSWPISMIFLKFLQQNYDYSVQDNKSFVSCLCSVHVTIIESGRNLISTQFDVITNDFVIVFCP